MLILVYELIIFYLFYVVELSKNAALCQLNLSITLQTRSRMNFFFYSTGGEGWKACSESSLVTNSSMYDVSFIPLDLGNGRWPFSILPFILQTKLFLIAFSIVNYVKYLIYNNFLPSHHLQSRTSE